MDVRVGLWRKLSAEELMLLNCKVGKILENPLYCKEIKPVNPKGNQSCIFFGRTNAEAEAPILWPPDVKNWLAGKDPDAAKDWKQEENGVTENEMVGWHLRLNRHEFEQTQEILKDREAWRAAVHELTNSQTWFSYWITTTTHSKPSLNNDKLNCG